MIAAVKGWHAVLAALLFFIPPGASAAEDGNGAARELARKTVAFAGRGEAVSVAWSNISSLVSSELVRIRGAFAAALREAGGRISDGTAPAEARVTLSENRTEYLLVEEVRKGDDRQVWISGWKRADPESTNSPGVTLEKKMVWEQEEAMLDVAFPAGDMVVLSPTKVMLYSRQSGQWAPSAAIPLSPPHPWPRDMRGRLRINAQSFQTYLPGVACNGAVEPSLTLECKPSEEPWVLESGSRATLLGYFVPAKDYFDGRVITQNGVKKNVAPFYSAASVEEQGLESGVGHAQKTPLKGLRFESLAEAQSYLDHWEERWADTRIHGTTKRQVAAMFAEERPALLALPVEPFRYYQYGERTVHLNGCVEVEAAYYGAPPGWIGRRVHVQWDVHQVRLLNPQTGELLREHLRHARGGHRIKEDDPTQTYPAGHHATAGPSRSRRTPDRSGLPRHASPRR